MVEPTKDTDTLSDTHARRGAQKRMLWKLCAILVAVVAFMSLRGLETAKRSYDEEHSRPVVIVDDEDVAKVVNELRDARLIRISEVENAFNRETRKEIKEPIRKIKYQNFAGGKQIIDRLDEEILADAEYRKKSFLAIEEAENRAQASKLPDLSQDRAAVTDSLRELYRTEKEISQERSITPEELQKWIDGDKSGVGIALPTQKDIKEWREKIKTDTTLEKEKLQSWLVAIDQQSNDQVRLSGLKRRIEQIDDRAQQLMKAVYTELKPSLPAIIKRAVNAPQENTSALAVLSPRSVLNANSGIHVIYQTLWLVCVMLLVFALIFILLLALRPLPYFATGTDALMQHAGELFKPSAGAAPQLAKSLAVTVAALGIGTAVAVASSNAGGGKTSVGDNGYVVAGEPETPQDKPGNNGKPPTPPRWPGEIDIHEVKLLEPIVYPSPVTIGGPTTVDIPPNAFAPLITALTRQPLPPADLDKRIIDITGSLIGDRLKALDVPALRKSTEDLTKSNTELVKQISVLESWRTTFGSKFTDNLSSLSNDLGATKAAVEDLRDTSFERQPDSGGRNILARAVQVFRGGKYLVTGQSLKALRSLMVKKSPQECSPPANTTGDTTSKQKCCEKEITTAEYSCDPNIEAIIRQLASMVGNPPASESGLLREVRLAQRLDHTTVSPRVVDQWKSIILKYTRVAY